MILAVFDEAFKDAPFKVAKYAFGERITECIDAFDGGAANEDEDLAAYAKGYAEDEFMFVCDWIEECAKLLNAPVSEFTACGWDYRHSLSLSTIAGNYEATGATLDDDEDDDESVDPDAVKGKVIGTFKDDDSTVTLIHH